MAARKGAGNITVTYNAQAITNYLNQTSLQATVAELEATHFGSSAEEFDAGLTGWTVSFSGDWATALDTIIGPDAITSTKRTVVIALNGGSGATATYTWTSNGFVTNYNPSADATGKITHSAQLRLSGAPNRGVA
jgi:hypothetical protein